MRAIFRYFTSYRIIAITCFVLTVIAVVSIWGQSLKSCYLAEGMEVSVASEWKTGRPFAYRVLIPAMADGIKLITPKHIKRRIKKLAASEPDVARFVPANFMPARYAYTGLTMAVLMGLFYAGYAWMMYCCAKAFFPGDRAIALLTPWVSIFIICPFLIPRTYYYDSPTLFFWAAALYCMQMRHWKTLLLALLLATLNKESSVMMIVFFAIAYRHRRDLLNVRQYWYLLGAQSIIYAAIRIGLEIVFADNPGEPAKFLLFDNFFNDMITGYPMDQVLWFLVAGFLIVWRLPDKPFLLRESLWMLIPFYVMYRLVGCCGEWRVFFELFPALTLMSMHTLMHATGLSQNPVFQQKNLK